MKEFNETVEEGERRRGKTRETKGKISSRIPHEGYYLGLWNGNVHIAHRTSCTPIRLKTPRSRVCPLCFFELLLSWPAVHVVVTRALSSAHANYLYCPCRYAQLINIQWQNSSCCQLWESCILYRNTFYTQLTQMLLISEHGGLLSKVSFLFSISQ